MTRGGGAKDLVEDVLLKLIELELGPIVVLEIDVLFGGILIELLDTRGGGAKDRVELERLKVIELELG